MFLISIWFALRNGFLATLKALSRTPPRFQRLVFNSAQDGAESILMALPESISSAERTLPRQEDPPAGGDSSVCVGAG